MSTNQDLCCYAKISYAFKVLIVKLTDKFLVLWCYIARSLSHIAASYKPLF